MGAEAWVLLVLMTIGNNTTLVSMQEFKSYGSCAFAAQTVSQEATANVKTKCIPK